MRSSRRLALTRCLSLALFAGSISACASTPPIVTILGGLKCADLIPASHRQPVKGIGLLRLGATVGDLGAALDGQTARLDQANGHTADVVAIADACQKRQLELLEQLKPAPWWARWR